MATCVYKCGWLSKYAYDYLKLLERQDLWLTHLLCISRVIEIVEKIPDLIPEEPSILYTFGYKHAALEYRSNRRWSLADLNNSIGLYLYYV